VVLVNAHSNEKVDHAQAIAQPAWPAAARPRRAAPLAPAALGADAVRRCRRRRTAKIEAMQEQQMLMLAQLKRTLAAMPPADPKQATNPEAARAKRSAAT
jgi:protein TonB